MTLRTAESVRWIVGLALMGTLLGVGMTWVMPQVYDASVSFDVQRINKQSTQEYQFDGYYEIQASDLFSQTVISWFLTPSVLSEMYDRAGIDSQIQNISEYARRFSAKKYSPQNIVVTFQEKTESRAQKLAGAVVEVVEGRSQELNKTQDNRALFLIQGATPVIAEHEYPISLYGSIGAVAGALLGLAVFSYRRGME